MITDYYALCRQIINHHFSSLKSLIQRHQKPDAGNVNQNRHLYFLIWADDVHIQGQRVCVVGVGSVLYRIAGEGRCNVKCRGAF